MYTQFRHGFGTFSGLFVFGIVSLICLLGVGRWVADQTAIPTQGTATIKPASMTSGAKATLLPAARSIERLHRSPSQTATPSGEIDSSNPLGISSSRDGEHPLLPVLRWAESRLPELRNVRDYECVFHKRERVDGELLDREVMNLKVRHRPFSVYMHYIAPHEMHGREVIYVQGANDNKLLAHLTGFKSVVGTRGIDPRGSLAMEANRYPITEIGIARLTERLIEVGRRELNYPDCQVIMKPARVDRQDCTRIDVLHAVKAPHFLYHKVKIYVSHQNSLPIRFEAYDWPSSSDQDPALVEEYTYQKLQLNPGLSETDFDTTNTAYNF